MQKVYGPARTTSRMIYTSRSCSKSKLPGLYQHLTFIMLRQVCAKAYVLLDIYVHQNYDIGLGSIAPWRWKTMIMCFIS